MNLQQFQYILAVAEHQHFELSAEKCCITQSTLSTMISKFEDEIGVKIFDRKRKPVQATEEGKLVIERIKIVVAHIEELHETIKEIKGETTGTLKLSIIPTIAPYLLPIFLQDFAKKFPEMRITVKEETTSQIVRQIKSRELDIGIVSIPINESDIEEIQLYDETFVFYDLSSQKTGSTISIRDVDMNNLCLLEEGHCLRTQVMQLCELHEKNIMSKLNFEYKVGSIDSLLRFVKTNNASTLLPFLSTIGLPNGEKKYIYHFTAPVPFRRVGIVVHRHFAKKTLLEVLQKDIQLKIATLLPMEKSSGIQLSPL